MLQELFRMLSTDVVVRMVDKSANGNPRLSGLRPRVKSGSLGVFPHKDYGPGSPSIHLPVLPLHYPQLHATKTNPSNTPQLSFTSTFYSFFSSNNVIMKLLALLAFAPAAFAIINNGT